MPSLVPLIVFFAALGLCFWRANRPDRSHTILCVLAAVIWAALPIFEPSMRRSGYALIVLMFLVTGFTQPLRHRP
jgi:hypothetical protein